MSAPVIIVIQARLSSTRLPGKALLPLGGRPTILLCAQRAMNTGLPVLIATSDEQVDDPLAVALDAAGIAVFRGSREDVLNRFVMATEGQSDETLVVRLTANNVLPDGSFIDAILATFESSDLDYLGTDCPDGGFPSGMSAEIFRVSMLRLADKTTESAFDREHVTPWIRRNGRAAVYWAPNPGENRSHCRCALDDFNDYARLNVAFQGSENPAATAWQDLAARLELLSSRTDELRCPSIKTSDGRIRSRLTLGTVQLGMPYGIANRSGMPSENESRLLLQNAIDAGISAVDTARAYGVAEERLGALLSAAYRDRISIITKLDVLSEIPDSAPRDWVRSAVDASVYRSCNALRAKRIDTLLLHRWAHHDAWNGAAWGRLLEMKQDGLLEVIGASVSNPVEAIAALDDAHLGHLQCPVNILDWRWRSEAFLQAVQRRPDVIIHARSVLLQGLLSLEPAAWPRMSGFDARSLCSMLDKIASDFGRLDRIDLCLAYVRALPWVTSLVIGMEHSDQLRVNLRYMQTPPLDTDQVGLIQDSLPHVSEMILNPAQWKQANE